jgi:phage terminase small subunit
MSANLNQLANRAAQVLQTALGQKWPEPRLREALATICSPVEADLKRRDRETAKALTPKQEEFCRVYLETGNASEAYRAAYSTSKMKPATVTRTAKALLENRKIAARIDVLRLKISKRHEITEDRIVQELARIAFADFTDYAEYGPNGITLKPSSTLRPDQRSAIAEVQENVSGSGRSVRFKLHDKKGALETLAKYLGLLIERKEHSGPGGGPIETRRSDVKSLSDEELAAIIEESKE